MIDIDDIISAVAGVGVLIVIACLIVIGVAITVQTVEGIFR